MSGFGRRAECCRNRKMRVWLVALAIFLLLATTCRIAVHAYTPPSSQMMRPGRLIIPSEPMRQPEEKSVTLMLTFAYVPSLALLIFAILFTRPTLTLFHEPSNQS